MRSWIKTRTSDRESGGKQKNSAVWEEQEQVAIGVTIVPVKAATPNHIRLLHTGVELLTP